MADVPDDDACKARCCSLTTTVRSFAENAAACEIRMAADPRSAQVGQFLHDRCDRQVVRFVRKGINYPNRRSPFVYFASIQLSDPVSLTAKSEMKMCKGLPSAVPRCSVEISRGPAFL